MRAAIIIATYNENENIERLIKNIFDLRLSSSNQLHIIVIDDSSNDGTQDILKRLESQFHEKLHVFIRKERNRATAAIAGFKHALDLEVDCILEMDGDCSHKPEFIPQFLAFAQYYDVVIGSRYVEGGCVTGWPVTRKIISACSNAIYRMVLGTKIHDLSGGFKCYRRNVIENIELDQFFSRGYAVGVETLFRCYRKGFTFLEIPIAFQNREKGKSKFRVQEAAESLRVIGSLLLKYGRGSRILD
jgi:dolichol-phosphate mannosyltransferase